MEEKVAAFAQDEKVIANITNLQAETRYFLQQVSFHRFLKSSPSLKLNVLKKFKFELNLAKTIKLFFLLNICSILPQSLFFSRVTCSCGFQFGNRSGIAVFFLYRNPLRLLHLHLCRHSLQICFCSV